MAAPPRNNPDVVLNRRADVFFKLSVIPITQMLKKHTLMLQNNLAIRLNRFKNGNLKPADEPGNL